MVFGLAFLDTFSAALGLDAFFGLLLLDAFLAGTLDFLLYSLTMFPHSCGGGLGVSENPFSHQYT